MNQRNTKVPNKNTAHNASDDALDRAVLALRAEVDGDDHQLSRQTRAKLLARATPRRLAKRRLVWLTAAVACLGMPVAWAASTGRLAPALAAIARAWDGDAPGAQREQVVTVAPAPQTPPVVDQPVASELVVSPEPSGVRLPPVSVAEIEPTPSIAPSSAIRPPVPSPSQSAAEPSTIHIANDRGQVLFREAHELHFRGNDPAAALQAWDRYLAFAPQGTFAVEARYNRALALIRLGRNAEAAVALAPYAQGNVLPLGYRQAEATQLVDLLKKKSVPAGELLEQPAP